jgi:hypothetical protein
MLVYGATAGAVTVVVVEVLFETTEPVNVRLADDSPPNVIVKLKAPTSSGVPLTVRVVLPSTPVTSSPAGKPEAETPYAGLLS